MSKRQRITGDVIKHDHPEETQSLFEERLCELRDANRRTFRRIGFVLFLMSAAVFAPSLTFGFMNFDDGKNFIENWQFRGFNRSNLLWMWTTTHLGPYQPLSWMSLAMDYVLWGETVRGELRPIGFHLTNILLHAINVVLVFVLANRVLEIRFASSQRGLPAPVFPWGAAVAALLFGLHPLRVEVVAWSTERRELLSTTFLLASTLAYLRGCGSDGASKAWVSRGPYLVSLVWFCLSLLSKAIGMTFPVVLLILDAFLGRLPVDTGKNTDLWTVWRRRFLEKLPFVAITVPVMVMAILGQKNADAMMNWEKHPLTGRLTICCYAVAWYLRTTVMPFQLGLYYPYSLPVDPLEMKYLISELIVAAVSICLWINRKRWPDALVAWIISIVLASPILGLTQSGGQIAADRYTYLPCIPWALLAGGAWERWRRTRLSNRLDRPNRLPVISIGVLLIGLTTLTTLQLRLWSDPERLWMHTALVTSDNTFALMKLGSLKAESGHAEEAAGYYARTLEIDPGNPSAHCQLGSAFAKMGKVNDAFQCYQNALKLTPNYPVAYRQLASLFATQGNAKRAAESLETALRMNPQFIEAHLDYAELLRRYGKEGPAMDHLRKVLSIRPDQVSARKTLALLLRNSDHPDEAIEHWREYRRRAGLPSLSAEELRTDLQTADFDQP